MEAPSNINDSFFDGVYKKVWKKMMPVALTGVEIEFIIEICDLKEMDKVLDLMCGHGRHAIGLAEKGYQVKAVDNQPEYIEEIRNKGSNNSLPIEPVLDHALLYQPSEKFNAIICMGNSFSFFNKEEANRLLQNLSGFLETSGKIIINSWMIAEIAIKHFKTKDWYYVDDYKYLLDYEYYFDPCRIESIQHVISPDNKIETIKGVDYIFSLNEISDMLGLAGLKIASLFATPRKKPFKLGDAQVYIVVEKIKT